MSLEFQDLDLLEMEQEMSLGAQNQRGCCFFSIFYFFLVCLFGVFVFLCVFSTFQKTIYIRVLDVFPTKRGLKKQKT